MPIRHEAVADSWAMIIEQAAGHGNELLNAIEQQLKAANIPNVTVNQQDVSGGLFASKRRFLCVNHTSYRDYSVYIGAKEYGSHLDVGWYLTIQPGFLKRTMSKYATGNPQALSMHVDFFSQQDLHAFVSIIHHCVKRAVDVLLEELKQDPTPPGLNARSTGFLNVW